MSFFSKIGKAISKGVKSIGKVLGSVAQFAAPIAALIPGIGIPISAGLGIVGGLLGPKQAVEPVYTQPFFPTPVPTAGSPYALQARETDSGLGSIAALAAAFFLLA